MTRMTGPDCAVMCNLIHTHTHTHTHTHIGWKEKKTRRHERVGSEAANPDNLLKMQGGKHNVPRAYVRTVQVDRVCPLCRVRSEVFVKSIIDLPLGGPMRVAKNN